MTRDNAALHRYEIDDGDELGAFVQYRRAGDVITFVHTETLPGHTGKGIAKQLVFDALDDARRQGLAVIPDCPYVLKVIADHAGTYADLVPEDARARFGLADR